MDFKEYENPDDEKMIMRFRFCKENVYVSIYILKKKDNWSKIQNIVLGLCKKLGMINKIKNVMKIFKSVNNWDVFY